MIEDPDPDITPTRIHYDQSRERAQVRPGETQGDYERSRPGELVIPDALWGLIGLARHDKRIMGRITADQHHELSAWERRLKSTAQSVEIDNALSEIAAIIHTHHNVPAASIELRATCPKCGAEFTIEGGTS